MFRAKSFANIIVISLSLIVAFLFFSVYSLEAFADDGDDGYQPEIYDVTEGLTVIEDISDNNNLLNQLYYSDEQVLNCIGATEPSGEVALTSVTLAEEGYNKDKLLKICNEMGFTNVFTSKYYTQQSVYSNCDVVAFTINEKYVRKNGEIYRILMVPIRGTVGSEWYSDFHMGTGSEHQGFKTAARAVKGTIREYVKDPPIPADHTVLWFTGHSRGAAVANLIAGEITTDTDDTSDESWKNLVPPENVIAYTFACPAVNTFADESLKNIYNYNNRGDLIPTLPFEDEDWGGGFKRYGQTKELSISDLDNVKNRYQQINNEESGLDMNLQALHSLILSIAPNQEAYNTDSVQLGFDIAAFLLKASDPSIHTSDYELLEIFKAHSYTTGIEVIDDAIVGVEIGDVIYWSPYLTTAFIGKIVGAVTVSDVINLFNGEKLEYTVVLKYIENAMDEAEQMSDWDSGDEEQHRKYEAWQRWKIDNAGTIELIRIYTGVQIEMIADLKEAHSACEENSAIFLGVADPVVKVIELLVGEGASNVKAQIVQGHEPSTYRLWTNSMYYGYRGWYNYNNAENNITRVNWEGREQKAIVGEECFFGCNGIEYVEVPEGCNWIGNNAFYNCKGIKTVTIPDNVAIGSEAFRKCTSLKNIDIGSEGVEIGQSAFAECDSLEELTIPDHIGKLNAYSFGNCTSLTKLTTPCEPEYYPPISGVGPFDNCPIKDLTITKGREGEYFDTDFFYTTAVTTAEKVTIYEGVKSLGKNMFDSSLKVLELPSTIERLSSKPIKDRSNPMEVEFINYYGDIVSWCNIDFNDYPLFRIGNGDFYIKGKLVKEVVIPAGTKKINPYAFSCCNSITSVSVEDGLEEIGDYSFNYCGAIKSVSIPDNVTIGASAFSNCDSLTEINLGSEGVNIGISAFSYCDALEELTIPDHIGKLSPSSFGNCSALTKLTAPCENDYYPSISGAGPFVNCNITDLTIIKGREGDYIDTDFNYSTALTTAEKVTIAEGVKSLGKHMFDNKVKTLILPSTLEKTDNPIKNNYNDISIDKINYNGDIASWCNIDFNGYSLIRLGAGDFYVKDELLTDLVVPEGVTKISPVAFNNCTCIVTVSIPSTLTEVGNDAFNYCSNLTDVYYNDTEEAWDRITIGSNNDPLKNATRHYKEIPVTVPLDDAEVSGITNKTYTGETITQTMTVQLGEAVLEEGTDYSIEYRDNTNIGTATLIITGTGSYTGTIEKTFKISGSLSKAATKASVGSVAAKVYTGSAIKPTPAVKAVGTSGKVMTLVKDTDYTLSYTKNTAIGKATITIKGKGNYTGSITKTFTINPPKVTGLKLKSPKAKQLKVTWTKAKGGVSYQIWYRLKGKSTWKKTTATGTSKLLKSLKAGKAYQVKVRAFKKVSGTTYYGAWTAVKTLKVKK